LEIERDFGTFLCEAVWNKNVGRDVRPNTYSRRKHLVVEVDAPDISGYCGGELVSFVALDLLIDLMSGLTEMVP
jgi:hypothetical protein